MRVSNWKDYELVDATEGTRLERWGDIILIRPDPQVIWNTGKKHSLWKEANAVYHRSHTGGGYWETLKKTPQEWKISYNTLQFRLKMMGFKHTGIFPEQATNWDFVASEIRKSPRKLKILNLFAYTGGATLTAAAAGAEVCHVDASKGMVTWGKENAQISGLSASPIRWLVDDCIKFVERETRRGNKYDGIIMDPPSYGRGPGGEVWKLEDRLFEFLRGCRNILSENARFVILNSYTTGLSPSVMEYILGVTVANELGGHVVSDELGLPVATTGLVLPCGSAAIWRAGQ